MIAIERCGDVSEWETAPFDVFLLNLFCSLALAGSCVYCGLLHSASLLTHTNFDRHLLHHAAADDPQEHFFADPTAP